MRNFVKCLGFSVGLGASLYFAGCTINTTNSSNDAGLPQSDAGLPSADAGGGGGTQVLDSGSTQDVSSIDAGALPDSGSVPDSGNVSTPDGGTEASTTPDAGVDAPPVVLSVVPLSGDACKITTPTHWAPAVYVAKDCDIRVTSSLQIDAGAVIKFGNGRGMQIEATGTLLSAGTAAAPIVYTSIKDDAHGGDSNGDGVVTSAAGGDWSGVSVAASGSKFDYCAFYYAAAEERPALDVANESASVTVTNSVFAHNRTTTDAITASPALDLSGAAAGTVVTGNTFFDNMVPLAINANLSLDDSNTFDNAAASPSAPQPNKYNGVIVRGCGDIKSSITWAATKVPLVIGNPVDACNYLDIVGAGHLTLADNVVVKFFNDGRISVDGILTAKASAGKKIVFTSIRDDAHGGDTNADGAATAPAGADWQGVNLLANSSAFDRAEFYYGSGSNTSALAVKRSNVAVSVTNSVFAHNRPESDTIDTSPALDLSEAAAATVVTGNLFYDNLIPLSINTTFSLDDSNGFDNATAAPTAPQPNKYNGILVRGCGDVGSSISWSPTKVPLIVGNPNDACTYMDVLGGGHLTVGTKVTVKFFSGGRINIAAAGTVTPAADSVFTSIKDDAHGGDTNADSTATTPAAADWEGIKQGSDCLTWTSILYATCT